MSNTQQRKPKTLGEARAAAMAHPLVGAILAADDRPYKDVEVPEWGGIEIRVRGADGTTVDRHDTNMFAMRATADGDMKLELGTNYRAKFLVGCLFDPATDEPLPITAEQLGAKAGKVINRLFGIAQSLSGRGPEAVKDAEKNSEAGPTGSSTSA